MSGARPAPISHFLKNAIKSEPLGGRGYYIQDFHISTIPTTWWKFKKNPWSKGDMPWMIWHGITQWSIFFPLSSCCYHQCQKCLLSIFITAIVREIYFFIKIMQPVRNYNYNCITEKMESNRWRLLKKICHKFISCVYC